VSFSDRDVERIKKPGVMITDGDIEALLARLEAAEYALKLSLDEDEEYSACAFTYAMKTWRVAAGKESGNG
jgi:hypothetical protein